MLEQETIGIYEWFGVVEKDGQKIGIGRAFNGTAFAVATGCYADIEALPNGDCGESIENSVKWLRGIVNNPYQAERAAYQLIINLISMLRPDDDTPWHHELFAYFLLDLFAANWPIGEYAKAQGKELPVSK